MSEKERTEQEKQEEREEILENEQDLLSALLDAHNDKESRTAKIEIARQGKVFFTFRIRGMDDSEQDKLSRKYTKHKGRGRNRRQDFDASGFTNEFIYQATVEEDRKKLWDNKQVWDKLNVLSGPELVGKVLTAGEKNAVGDKILDLSGYAEDEEDVFEEAKN